MPVRLEEIKNIAVVGAGLMGHGIALTYALAGFRVFLNDLNDEILKNAFAHIQENLEIFAENNLIKREAVKETLARITLTSDLEKAVRGADFVTEAIIEERTAKRELFNQLDRLCPPHTIIASNTSSLLISDFGAETKREDKLVITHWFNPPHIVPVVEVVKAEKTSEETVDLVYMLLQRAGKLPVKIFKEIPGFLVNRVQAAAIREVWSLWEQGVASSTDIDLAIKGSFGFRLAGMGPLQICDLGGLDLWYKVGVNLFKVINSSTEPPPALKEKVDRGELGLKTGKGFYDYSTSYYQENWDEVVKKRDAQLLQLLKLLYWPSKI